jgi:hypothetical protein
LTIGDPWTVLDQNMATGEFFSGGPWTFDCRASHCKFFITDLFVVSDRFEVYDNDVLVATTSLVPDWDTRGEPGPFSAPPWTDDPDVAFASGDFSKAVIYFLAGAHSITIRDIHIPPTTAGGNPFPDGTVAFRVTVPEPGTLALLGLALAGLGFSRRKAS